MGIARAEESVGQGLRNLRIDLRFERSSEFRTSFLCAAAGKADLGVGHRDEVKRAGALAAAKADARVVMKVRNQRVRPLTDTKILASWNGLMIRGFADAGRVFKQPKYTQAAADAANFVLSKMRTKDGRLYRTHSAGEAKLNAYLDDYAFFCDGLIALFKATGDTKWLQSAAELTDLQIKLYQDDARGGFYFTSQDHESLIARGKQPTDGAQPAGNSVAVQNLIYLAEQLNRPDYREVAGKALSATAPLLQKSPRIAPRMALGLAEYLQLDGSSKP